MKSNKLKQPYYVASVSGGKDSLYMFHIILQNPKKYPLDGAIFFDLGIDYPFVEDVVNHIENECRKRNIPFLRFKPRKNWEELYEKHGFPTRVARWCNKLKMDAAKQADEYIDSLGCRAVTYIGYCKDEEKRYSKRTGKSECYPLVEEGIEEKTILEWAKKQPIFNHYYEVNTRSGCMYCPMQSRVTFAYLYKHYPENFKYMIGKMRETEKKMSERYGRPFSVISGNAKYNADYLEKNIKEKWLPILNEKEGKMSD